MKKQRAKAEKIIYYDDELNDDFAGTHLKTKKVDENFKFVHKNPFWRLGSFLIYYLIAVPVVWFYMRVILRVKFVNAKSIKKYKGTYFLYGNHTGVIDAFTPNLLSLPKRNKIICGADAVSIKGLKNITQMLGALPLPTETRGMKHFIKAVDFYHQKYNFTIYPEAHIWPYYTGVRQFSSAPFGYPVKYGCATFAFFTAYSKPKGFLSFLRKANVTVYVSDAIFPDEGLSVPEAKKNLRDKVYNFMLEKSKFSDYRVIKYVANVKDESVCE